MDTPRLLSKAFSGQGPRQEAIAAERSLTPTLAGQKPLKALIGVNPEARRLSDPDHSRVHHPLARAYAHTGMMRVAIVGHLLMKEVMGFCPTGWPANGSNLAKEFSMQSIPLEVKIRSQRLHKEDMNSISRRVEAFSA